MIPYQRLCDEEKWVNSSILHLLLFKVFKKAYLSLLNIWKWCSNLEADLIFKSQLQLDFKQFWKSYLNLYSCKWLRPTRSLVISLIPLWLSQLKLLLEENLTNLRILFLKILIIFEFRRLCSYLFHLMIVKGKRELLKKLCLILKKIMLSTCHLNVISICIRF